VPSNLPTCPSCAGKHKVPRGGGGWDRCPVCRPIARSFACSDCTAKAGEPCKSARGGRLSTFHTRRTYLMQDAALKWAL